MIESLTDDQVAQLKVYKDKWIERGLSTAEINPEKSMEILARIYKGRDFPAPTKFEVYDSPFEAITEMKVRYDLTIRPVDFIYGNQSAPWLSFYDYFSKVVKVECYDLLEDYFELAEHCSWTLLFDELVVFVRAPTHIKFDDEDRTHCENDLAIKFNDGTGVAIWHGTRIPQEWIFDKSSITPEVILKWSNIEQRRCACELLGWDKAIESMQSTIIDKDDDPTVGTLYSVDIPDIGKEMFLVALDPNTNSRVGLPVPPEMETALEANSWTYGVDKEDFNPEFRT